MKKREGFTLIEMMVVVVIIGILVAIAFPSYQQYVLRSHRVEARNTLQTIAQRIEQHYKITRSYNTLSTDVGGARQLNNATLVAWGLNVSPARGNARYNITFFQAPNAAGYTLRAQAVGAQQGDIRCGEFFLNQSGARMARAVGDAAAPAINNEASRECWTR